ncbi:terminase family protein, partial [Streptomyces sioyaensis]|uniref:terminase large subunit domain-containing protein n=1 Tax=Streptomyces sioyaensis TaxID=67364 RepID=UPI0033FD8510
MTTVTDPESREQRLVAHYRSLPFTERRRVARKASPEVRARLAYEEQQIAMDRSPGGLAAIITEGRELQAPHLNMIDQAFKRIAGGEQLQVMLTCPPRHGKSQRVSRWGPLWYLRRNPTHRVMIASYGAELADDHGRWVRDQLKEYSGTLGIRLNPASHAANRFDLEQPRGSSVRGGMVTAGVGGGLTGKGFDLGIIDDPFKGNDDSGSPAQRDRVYDWYRSVFYTRRAPGASIILVNTRWHEDDLSGRLLQNEPHRWIQIDLPAIADSPNDPLGRKIGQALWPSQYNEAALADTRETLGERIWYSMYQQKPRPLEGGVWKWAWITSNRLKPEAWTGIDPTRVVVAVDHAGGDSLRNDEVGLACAARDRDGD